jgi:hypothetical protein
MAVNLENGSKSLFGETAEQRPPPPKKNTNVRE